MSWKKRTKASTKYQQIKIILSKNPKSKKGLNQCIKLPFLIMASKCLCEYISAQFSPEAKFLSNWVMPCSLMILHSHSFFFFQCNFIQKHFHLLRNYSWQNFTHATQKFHPDVWALMNAWNPILYISHFDHTSICEVTLILSSIFIVRRHLYSFVFAQFSICFCLILRAESVLEQIIVLHQVLSFSFFNNFVSWFALTHICKIKNSVHESLRYSISS